MTAQYREGGDIVAERYEVLEYIGEGSFAQVYRCLDRTLGREVAIKMMRVETMIAKGNGAREDFIERFNREVLAVAKLTDPYTVTLFDSGTAANGDLYMALEYVPGQTLDAYIHEHGAMPHEQAVKLLKQSLFSLREAHVHGIIHRDIKPENILIFEGLGGEMQIRIVDFGISKALQSSAKDLTAVGLVVGTPRYLSPERVTQGELTPASDLYSLGLVMHYLLCGKEVFAETSRAMDLVKLHISPEPILLPASLDIPETLRRIVEKMMAKDLSDRYRAAQPILDDLDAHILEYKIAQRNAQRADTQEREITASAKPSLNTFPAVSPPQGDDPSVAKTEIMESIAEPGTAPLQLGREREAEATEMVKLPVEFPAGSPHAPSPIPASVATAQGATSPSAPDASAKQKFSPNTFSAPAIRRPASPQTESNQRGSTQATTPPEASLPSQRNSLASDPRLKYVIIALAVAAVMMLMMIVVTMLIWKFVINA